MSESYREMYRDAMIRACASENLLEEMQTESEGLKARIAELEREIDVLKYGAVCVQAEPKGNSNG